MQEIRDRQRLELAFKAWVKNSKSRRAFDLMEIFQEGTATGGIHRLLEALSSYYGDEYPCAITGDDKEDILAATTDLITLLADVLSAYQDPTWDPYEKEEIMSLPDPKDFL